MFDTMSLFHQVTARQKGPAARQARASGGARASQHISGGCPKILGVLEANDISGCIIDFHICSISTHGLPILRDKAKMDVPTLYTESWGHRTMCRFSWCSSEKKQPPCVMNYSLFRASRYDIMSFFLHAWKLRKLLDFQY